MDESIVEIMQRVQEPEPFQLKSLMELRKEDLGLEVFEKSDLRKPGKGGASLDLSRCCNKSKLGGKNQQVFPCSSVGAREDRNGERVLDRNGDEIHDVVHVSKSNWRGLVVAGISKVDINLVIKPNDMVFLGHKLKACQFAGNVRQKIAERAVACAEKPKLLFAYDHR